MIAEEKYLETKKIFMDCILIMQEYKSQNKKIKTNSGRPKNIITINQKIDNVNLIFKNRPLFSYYELINELKVFFKLGEVGCKKLLTQLQKDKIIIKTGLRGKYQKC